MTLIFLFFSSLQKLSGHPKSRCEEALLKAIYQSEQLTSAITLSDVRAHTVVAQHRSRVRGREACVMVPVSWVYYNLSHACSGGPPGSDPSPDQLFP